MSATIRRVLFLIALVGLASAVDSMYVHLQMVSHPGYLAFCDVSTTISCTHVYQSRYATLAGVSVALLGAMWYVAVLVLLATARWGWPSLQENVPGYVFALATFGLGFILYMAYASLILLKTVCLLCVVTYVAVTAIFLISGLRMPYPMTTIPRRLWQDAKAAVARPAALASILALLVAATLAVAFFPHRIAAAEAAVPGQALADRQSEFMRFWQSRPRMMVPVSPEGAAVLIVRFSDFQCPHCADSHFAYKPILARFSAQYPGAVRLVEMDYPLQQECNPAGSPTGHPASCAAAAALRMARAKGHGEALEDWLYTNQAALTPASVRQAALDISGVKDFDAQYPFALSQVKTDVAIGAGLGVRVTPTFFINGIKLEGALPPQYFEMAIRHELTRAGKTP
jgi:uncharacterized membrane protein/protein-disulfide isomerase